MGVLLKNQIMEAYHYTPLHYLVFIARSQMLLSKPAILKNGFSQNHFRSMSNNQDVIRGFGPYVHLTLDSSPRILKSKLAAGFPHVGVVIPAHNIEEVSFSLCRYNVAMTRFLRRGDKKGFPESSCNGRYYGNHQIPIAKNTADQSAMLEKHLKINTMIEILIKDRFVLPNDTKIKCYNSEDAQLAKSILKDLDREWEVFISSRVENYPNNDNYNYAVKDFIQTAMSNPEWRGNGLEYDRV